METPFTAYLIREAGLSHNQVRTLEPLLHTRTFAKGEVLFNSGSICRHAFFVEKGLLRFYSTEATGKEHIIQFAPENWFITDRSSTYFNEPSPYTIAAIEETQATQVSPEFIKEASAASPAFREHNERILQNHIRQLQNRIHMLLAASAEERYLHFIRLYPDLTLRVPQWMIASYLGITPESLSRVRKELAKRNS